MPEVAAVTPVEITVSEACEHGTFTISMGSPGVWVFPGFGRCESGPEDVWVFHPVEALCSCYEDDEDSS